MAYLKFFLFYLGDVLIFTFSPWFLLPSTVFTNVRKRRLRRKRRVGCAFIIELYSVQTNMETVEKRKSVINTKKKNYLHRYLQAPNHSYKNKMIFIYFNSELILFSNSFFNQNAPPQKNKRGLKVISPMIVDCSSKSRYVTYGMVLISSLVYKLLLFEVATIIVIYLIASLTKFTSVFHYASVLSQIYVP